MWRCEMEEGREEVERVIREDIERMGNNGE